MNEVIQLLTKELREHLLAENIAGIPESWFVKTKGQDGGEFEAKKVFAEKEVSALKPALERGSLGWEELEREALACVRCRLAEGRKKVVFGVGARNRPPICFVGEGPGADEDRQGEPFVGKAGALLTAAITKGLGLQRQDVYIANIVKCRPPENRTPQPDELSCCLPFLHRQLELLQPQVIVTLGAPALLALTGLTGGITKLRGHWLEWRSIPLMPTFHPAYILRNATAKRPFWEDLQEVMKKLGLSRGSEGR